jgi:hypothetical protein
MAAVAKAPENGTLRQWIVTRPGPAGEVRAEVVGLPELHATAKSRDEAIERIRTLLQEWLAAGKLLSIDVPGANPLLNFPGHLDPNDPLEQEFVAELNRLRREDREQAVQEADRE